MLLCIMHVGTPGFSKAVWDDLNGFVSFVKFVEAKKSRKNPQKPHDLFDLTMFYSLLPIIENMPSSDDNVMLVFKFELLDYGAITFQANFVSFDYILF